MDEAVKTAVGFGALRPTRITATPERMAVAAERHGKRLGHLRDGARDLDRAPRRLHVLHREPSVLRERGNSRHVLGTGAELGSELIQGDTPLRGTCGGNFLRPGTGTPTGFSIPPMLTSTRRRIMISDDNVSSGSAAPKRLAPGAGRNSLPSIRT